MNNTNPSTQNPLYTYVLTYYIDNDRMEECYSTANEAIDNLCELGKGCVRRELWANMQG